MHTAFWSEYCQTKAVNGHLLCDIPRNFSVDSGTEAGYVF